MQIKLDTILHWLLLANSQANHFPQIPMILKQKVERLQPLSLFLSLSLRLSLPLFSVSLSLSLSPSPPPLSLSHSLSLLHIHTSHSFYFTEVTGQVRLTNLVFVAELSDKMSNSFNQNEKMFCNAVRNITQFLLLLISLCHWLISLQCIICYFLFNIFFT